MKDIKTMLPKVGIGRRCGAIQANVDRYRALMSDKLYEELLALGKELAGVGSMEVNVFQRYVMSSSRSPCGRDSDWSCPKPSGRKNRWLRETPEAFRCSFLSPITKTSSPA